MSAQTVARWNAIPLERPEGDTRNSYLKRPHDDDSDGDVSLVSRTPSPPPEGMDVDPDDITRYDDHHYGPAREVITVDTKIKATNKGFAMLAKMGWVEGQPVGLSGEGRVEPVPFTIKNDQTGLGKASQDVEMIETTVAQRRNLDSERQRKETEEQRRAREKTVARQQAVQEELSTTLRPFYCALCDKQFKNVAQYDEHTNSYAHAHKAREKDMRAALKIGQTSTDARKEKERKREERELRKIAAAAGIRMPKPAAPAGGASSSDQQPSAPPKPGGWATVSSAPPPPSANSGSDGAPSVGGANDNSGAGPRNTAALGGWSDVGAGLGGPSAPPPPEALAVPAPAHTPAFRSSGFTSLDTTSWPQSPLPPSAVQPGHGGWSTVSNPSPAPAPVAPAQAPAPAAGSGGWATVRDAAPPPTPTTNRGGWAPVVAPQVVPAAEAQLPSAVDPVAPGPASAATPPAGRPARPPPGVVREEKRQGWQQFRQGKGRR